MNSKSDRFVEACLIMISCFVLLGCASRNKPAIVQVLNRAHAHNDYEHSRPLLDALDHGFMSVEADINLVEGELLVAHHRLLTNPNRTLRSLYLEPLRQRVEANDGVVYHGQSRPFLLLVDIKSDAKKTYDVLHKQLSEYAAMLHVVRENELKTGPIQVVISGSRPIEKMRAQSLRFAGYDGRLGDLDSDATVHLMPLISDNAKKLFTWRGSKPMPADELTRLRDVVKKAHARGRKVRFWATPDRQSVWWLLHREGVDYINTDDLAGLASFLRKSGL